MDLHVFFCETNTTQYQYKSRQDWWYEVKPLYSNATCCLNYNEEVLMYVGMIFLIKYSTHMLNLFSEYIT